MEVLYLLKGYRNLKNVPIWRTDVKFSQDFLHIFFVQGTPSNINRNLSFKERATLNWTQWEIPPTPHTYSVLIQPDGWIQQQNDHDGRGRTPHGKMQNRKHVSSNPTIKIVKKINGIFDEWHRKEYIDFWTQHRYTDYRRYIMMIICRLLRPTVSTIELVT